ncbi:hypothetical protein [Blastopirellula marina]|nr:hypothetical protein [Blastopirellula marina]
MSQITYDAESTPAVRDAVPWRTPAFACCYGVAMIAVMAQLTLTHLGLVWQTCIPCLAASLAIGFYLLAISPSRFALTFFILGGSHAIVVAIAYWSFWRDNPEMANMLFLRHGLVFWSATALLSAAIAYWNRRRCWRIQRIIDEEPTSPKRISLPITTLDCVYLTAILVAMGLFQKWAIGPLAESLPMGIVVVIMLAGYMRCGLSPGGRGFSPVAMIFTGLGCLSFGCLILWVYYPQHSAFPIMLVGIPAILWSGVLLSLRGDGYRLVRDFSTIADKAPIAEPDPLA